MATPLPAKTPAADAPPARSHLPADVVAERCRDRSLARGLSPRPSSYSMQRSVESTPRAAASAKKPVLAAQSFNAAEEDAKREAWEDHRGACGIAAAHGPTRRGDEALIEAARGCHRVCRSGAAVHSS